MSSERAFFTMNYLHSKIRNSLTFKRVNKLQYIYINERSLKKQEKAGFSKSKLLKMKDAWLQQENNSILEKRRREEGNFEEDEDENP